MSRGYDVMHQTEVNHSWLLVEMGIYFMPLHICQKNKKGGDFSSKTNPLLVVDLWKLVTSSFDAWNELLVNTTPTALCRDHIDLKIPLKKHANQENKLIDLVLILAKKG